MAKKKPSAEINLAVLFWFYKEPEICENRLKLLKKYNPGLKIFGLYGGEAGEAFLYQEKLGEYLDDFYLSPFKDPKWKWINGDLVILDWYSKRGKSLSWDSLFIVQWDALVLGSLKDCFPGLKKGQLFLSGPRVLDKSTERIWFWTTPLRPRERRNYLEFIGYVKSQYGYEERPWLCVFVFEIFPHSFFERYALVGKREIGMLEYRVPTYARIFKIPFYEKDIGVWSRWRERLTQPEKIALSALPVPIKKSYIEKQLQKKDGYRIFHPYYQPWVL